MKKSVPILLIFLFLFSTNINAQKYYNLGISIGGTSYFGDLGNEDFLQYTSLRPGTVVTFRNFINNPVRSGKYFRSLDVEARLSWHRIGYDETQSIGSSKGTDLRNFRRGLSFRSDIYGATSNITYSFYPNKFAPIYKQKAVFYVFAGLGMFYSQAKADLFNGNVDINNRYFFWSDGSVRDAAESSGSGNIIKKDKEFETNLSDWYTENASYSPLSVAVPYGIGLRWGVSKKITLSAEMSYYYFFTDYIDDVSDRYATFEEIEKRFPNDPEKQILAAYITDPTGYGSTGYDDQFTSPRGNPDYNDAYSFISFEVSYNFKDLRFKKGKSLSIFN